MPMSGLTLDLPVLCTKCCPFKTTRSFSCYLFSVSISSSAIRNSDNADFPFFSVPPIPSHHARPFPQILQESTPQNFPLDIGMSDKPNLHYHLSRENHSNYLQVSSTISLQTDRRVNNSCYSLFLHLPMQHQNVLIQNVGVQDSMFKVVNRNRNSTFAIIIIKISCQILEKSGTRMCGS